MFRGKMWWLGCCFLQNIKSLLGYILKTSGHTCECVHIVNLSAPPGGRRG